MDMCKKTTSKLIAKCEFKFLQKWLLGIIFIIRPVNHLVFSMEVVGPNNPSPLEHDLFKHFDNIWNKYMRMKYHKHK